MSLSLAPQHLRRWDAVTGTSYMQREQTNRVFEQINLNVDNLKFTRCSISSSTHITRLGKDRCEAEGVEGELAGAVFDVASVPKFPVIVTEQGEASRSLMWEEALCWDILFSIQFDAAFFTHSRDRDVLFKPRAWWCNILTRCCAQFRPLPDYQPVCLGLGNDVDTGSRGQRRFCSGPVALVEKTTLLWITEEFDEEKEMMYGGRELKKKKEKENTPREFRKSLEWPDCSLVDSVRQNLALLLRTQSNVFDSREGTTSLLFLVTNDMDACHLSSCQCYFFFNMHL